MVYKDNYDFGDKLLIYSIILYMVVAYWQMLEYLMLDFVQPNPADNIIALIITSLIYKDIIKRKG